MDPFTSIPKLHAAILACVASHNERNKPFRWTKTADEIHDKMRRFGLRTQQGYGVPWVGDYPGVPIGD